MYLLKISYDAITTISNQRFSLLKATTHPSTSSPFVQQTGHQTSPIALTQVYPYDSLSLWSTYLIPTQTALTGGCTTHWRVGNPSSSIHSTIVIELDQAFDTITIYTYNTLHAHVSADRFL